MHVLLIAPGFVPHSQQFIDALLDAGHAVTLLDRHNPKPLGAAGYKFIPFPGIPGFHRLSPHLTSRLEPWVRTVQMRRIWNRVRPDIVNVQGVDARAEYCVRAGLRPLVLSCWGSDINDLFETNDEDQGYQQRLSSMLGAAFHTSKDRRRVLSRYRRRIGSTLAGADYLTATTPQILARCERLAGRKLTANLFRFGVNLDLFKPGYEKEALALRDRLGIPHPARVFLSIRTIQPLMGHHHILEAFADITRDSDPSDAALVFKLFSSFPDEYERLKSRIEELGIENRVYWLGETPHEQMPVQYAMADIVINYPEQDGCPVSLFEAAACKRPVVSSNLAAYEGVFGDSFIMASPDDTQALKTALTRCLTEDETQTHRRVEKAFAVVCEIADRERNYERLFDAFDDLLIGHGRKGDSPSVSRSDYV